MNLLVSRSPVLLGIAFGLLLATPKPLPAENLDQIVDRASHAQDSLGNVILKTKLTISPSSGTPRENRVEFRLRRDGEVVQSWIGVMEPASLKGMQFVRNRMSASDDRLLLYIPATKQVRQIPAAAREKKFLNSDFSIADLQIRPSDLGQRKIVEETDRHWVVAARPSSPSMYEWILFTIDKKDFTVLRVCFYQAGHKMIKDLLVRSFDTVADTRLATQIEMKDLTSGSRTVLEVTNFQTNVADADLPARTFTAEFMREQK
ncbi:outer membrane lipoprotein-sorting protein [Aporhodopirellula aestuarii]|uniref:Outer membrane lipoprotein-sorting protein n=1 Tax=Aporhodopirellula aestuarii TaxID=2950107 RepID=A0ABT0U3Y5_9BACT|nr:outer membrane lipoprotein-sorting protein [Aporhodopirellula aestuarii]MCM2371556.1 outer membrane lipoprotein-sorting protein [Aporhodopirellula aestuarii]